MRDTVPTPAYVTVGVSHSRDAATAVREATEALALDETRFLLVFVPQGHDLEALAAALGQRCGGVPVFGCTSAGQITEMGYETEAFLVLAFPKAHFRCASVLFEPLNPLQITGIATHAKRLAENFSHTAGWNRLALVFADGLSKQEDLLISALSNVLDDMPVFGGSAGDGLRFEETFVLHNATFPRDAALLVLLETNLGFQGLGFDHFLPTDRQVVITEANPRERLVYEINGAPAACEYARLVGCKVEDLSPQVFAENPMLVEHNQNHYVRAISDATEGHALSFLAAIDDGLIMSLGKGREIMATLTDGLAIADCSGRAPDFILGFDCALRKLEIEHKQLSGAVSAVFRDRRVYGFNTFGEQHRGLHMNQTFVGIAFFGTDADGLT